MKKILSLLCVCVMAVSAFAYTADYTCANTNTVNITTSGNCTGSSLSWTYSAKTWSSPQIRLAADAYITFDISGLEVTQIQISASSTSYTGTWTASTGSVSVSSTTITWKGSATSSLKLTTSSAARLKSFKVTYTCASACTNPTITTQPQGATYTQGASATALSIVADGTGYQWYKNTTNSTSGATAISGATSSNYTPSTATTGTTYYYCVASNSTCTTTSNIVAVVVNAAPVYTVTARSNNESLGTVSGTTTIIASPKACVGYAALAYTVTGGTATVAQSGNTFTVSNMSANVTVTINFAEQAHDTYLDNVQSASMDGNYCGSYTAPAITDKSQATSGTCEQVHYHFVGWVSAANKSNPTDVNIVKAGTAMTANGTTYYAVWAKEAE